MIKTVYLLWVLCLPVIYGLAIVSSLWADTIKVGALLPMTGKLARFGDIENKAYQLAVEDLNAAGGIKGKKIQLIVGDTAGKPDVGQRIAEDLVLNDKVVCLIGCYSSSVAMKAAETAQKHKIPFLIHTASADKITEQGWEFIFRLNPPVSEHSNPLQSFLRKILRAQTIAILYEDSASGQFNARRIVRQCRTAGLDVVINESYATGTIEFDEQLNRVNNRSPDVLYMASNPVDAALLIQQAKSMELRIKAFIGNASGFASHEFFDYAGDAADLVISPIIWAPSVPYPGAMRFHTRFFNTFGFLPTYHGAQAYAAVQTIGDCLSRTENFRPNSIRTAMIETDVLSIFGPIKFMEYGKKAQQNRLPTYLVQWINGKLEIIWPSESASKKYIFPSPATP